MTEGQLYEKVGRLQAALDDQNQNYDRLLDLLGRVVSGEIDISRVLVNMTERSYSWSEPGASPAAPATINGLPKVIVGPAAQQLDGFKDNDGEVTITGRNLCVIRIEKKPDSTPAPA